MNFHIVIPARKGSKGYPEKNRHLLDHTIKSIPEEYMDRVIVTTNDEEIINKINETQSKCKIHRRSEESAIDTASTKECLEEVIDKFELKSDIIMLYLTYPERKWIDVIEAYEWFKGCSAKSMLCREELDTHPYLCLYDIEDNKGKQLVEHDLYRRQDYPKCFKISHMISIFNVNELKNLNMNLYNTDTVYYKIDSSLDVDYIEDMENLDD